MPEDPSLEALRAAARQQAVDRDTALARARDLGAQAGATEAGLAHSLAAGNLAGARAALDARQGLRAAAAAQVTDRLRLEEAARLALGQLGARIDPCDADPAVPLLLLPVRIETRYTADRTALRVRLFPDDVHVDRLERGLSEAERAAGLAWWTAAWRGAEAEQEAAWRGLVERVGRARAAWVGEATRPANLAARATEAPAFPATLAPAGIGGAARLLPDRFRVVALQAGQPSEATGNQIPALLPAALVPTEEATLVEAGGVRLAPGTEWIADYERALELGLAVTVPLARRGAPVDQLFAFGLRRSLGAEEAAAELTDLLRAHRFGAGLALVRQGTPTNNGEAARAAWQRRPDPQRPALDPPAVAEGSAAAVLAAALGLDPAVLAGLEGAEAREQPAARAANTALWNASWGSFLDRINSVGQAGAALSDDMREAGRRLHRDHVRGRGPLPTLRIGHQPYGLLPAGALDGPWVATPGDAFEKGLAQILRRARGWWRGGIGRVPRPAPGTPPEAMRDALGTAPVSFAVFVRQVLSEEATGLGIRASGGDPQEMLLEAALEQAIWHDLVNLSSPRSRIGFLGRQDRHLPLPHVAEDDPAFIAALLEQRAGQPNSLLQALLAISMDAALLEVRATAGQRVMEVFNRVAPTLDPPLRERVAGLARRVESIAPQVAPVAAAETLAAVAAELRVASGIAERPTLRAFQPVATTTSSFAELATQAKSSGVAATFDRFALQGWFEAQARMAELRGALAELAQVPLDQRRLLLSETLDTASHRLDAWVTALVERRRVAMRAARPRGVQIGAYGWVEGIVPGRGRQADGGFIHAPSLAHAATAGVLRSAWMQQQAAGGEGAFAIDLGSMRVRRALELIDGMRQGQPLGALLGYRVERVMHEGGAARLVRSLRAVAPLTQGRLTDRDAAADEAGRAAQEAVAAANVVDGVLLVTGWNAEAVVARLSQRPADNPYLTGDWPPVSAAERATLERAVAEAQDALDAVGDLLMAESVHQLVQGNLARAGAALDAAGNGEAPAPVPQVVTTPAEGLPVAHRLMLGVLGAPPAPAAGWDASRPRAAAEPALEAWAAARLGDPATIVVGAAADGTPLTLAAAGRAALDLLYDAADRAGFDQRLRAALPDLPPEAPLAEAPKPGWAPGLRAIGDVHALATALRGLLSAGRPALPIDLGVPNLPVARQVDPAWLSAAEARLRAALAGLEDRAEALDSQIEAGAPAAQVRDAMEGLAGFGIVAPGFSRADVLAGGGGDLGAVAELALAEAARRIGTAEAALARPASAASLAEAAEAIFGEGFRLLPMLAPAPAADGWDEALAAPPPGATRAAARRWLADAASVRDGARRLAEAILLAEVTGAPPMLRIAQQAGPGPEPPARWIGLPLGEGEPTPGTPVVAWMLDLLGAPDPAASVGALVLDEWVETLPLRARAGAPKPGEPPPAPRPRVTTGVAFHAAAPNARAPNAWLLAVPPDPARRWDSAALLTTLRETLELAKLRGVVLEHTVGAAALLPALYTRTASLQGEPVLRLGALAGRIIKTGPITAMKEANR
ncbi:hypothetical protein HB662_27775 [Roseomonas frigidaquae]|uniref:Uncharacterized protein n=1 Tax=Falsiroseomonas frigidaquae TaxID=487318 RepID=A0ABX1F8Q6_9PROT|nr:hypothetical protein [Falsiroseomonas frigidaquae]NKE48599.1 hypothetical protein [Falsiroseomonas frigidaquae]